MKMPYIQILTKSVKFSTSRMQRKRPKRKSYWRRLVKVQHDATTADFNEIVYVVVAAVKRTRNLTEVYDGSNEQ
jgi:hypothetical protein